LKLDEEKVREEREKLALSIDSAAEEAGVSPQTWLRAEHGGALRPSSVRRIAKLLGVVPDELRKKGLARA
jgi:transcriptional regulator with XRE-family HTH domain